MSPRPTLPPETLWLRRPPSSRLLSLHGLLTLTLAPRPTPPTLAAAARRAWRAVLVACPQIAAEGSCDAQWGGWLRCGGRAKLRVCFSSPCSCSPSSSCPSYDGDGDDGDDETAGGGVAAELSLRLRDRAAEGGATLEFRLRLDHLVTDGIGIRIVAARFFAEFARELGESGALLASAEEEEVGAEPATPWILRPLDETQEIDPEGLKEGVEEGYALLTRRFVRLPICCCCCGYSCSPFRAPHSFCFFPPAPRTVPLTPRSKPTTASPSSPSPPPLSSPPPPRPRLRHRRTTRAPSTPQRRAGCSPPPRRAARPARASPRSRTPP